MAVTKVQIKFGTNTLDQTFSAGAWDPAPIQGNLLVACLWHDEIETDVADISSAGWTRMNTFLASGLSTFRLSVFAKFAGVSEDAAVSVDLGEADRRAHLWVVEWSGQGFSVLPAKDTAAKVTKENTVSGTSNQVSASLVVPAGLIAVAHVGMTGTITDPSVAWDGDVVFGADANANFRGSAFGWLDGVDNEQPTATWIGSRTNAQMFVIIGEIATGLASFRDAVATMAAASDAAATDAVARDVGD